MKPLRVVMVTTFYPPHNFGGDGAFVHRLSDALARRGDRVEVVYDADAYRMSGGDAERETSAAPSGHPNVVVHPLRGGFAARADLLLSHQLGRPLAKSAQLRRLLERPGIDVIHFHNVSLMGGPGVLAYGSAIKLCTLHEYWFVCPMHVLWRFGREACQSATCIRCTLHGRRPPQLWRLGNAVARNAAKVDAFIAPSEAARRLLAERGFPQPMHVIPHFATDEDCGEQAGSSPHERPYFLYAGRLESLKGVDRLVDLFRHYRRADLVIAGDGTQAERLRRDAASLPNVIFAGQVSASALRQWYRNAIATLVPSLTYETFGLVALESIACGTPAIVRNIGALPEIIEQTGGGLVFDDDRALAEAMGRLQDDPGLRARIGAQGAAVARERFSEQRHLEEYDRLIEECARRRQAEVRR